MDIVTHFLMGILGASALEGRWPEAAGAFAFGSVLPDLDALSRLFGKRAFMRAHQTWSHALPVIGAIGLLAFGARELAGVHAPWAPLALVAGMTLHAVTDWTNTYGIMLLAPFTRRRFCREWVFFIDAVVIALCLLAVAALALRWNGPRGIEVQAAWAGALLLYWLAKVWLRRRALAASPPGTHSLLPSALVPWLFLGCARQGDRARTFRINALDGAVGNVREHALLDAQFAEALAALPEFAVMRGLSPGFHVLATEKQGANTVVHCRDLRTRNFATRFGSLDVILNPSGAVESLTFHV